MTITELKELLSSGQFHHATYRNQRTLWEGLWIYKRYEGLRGFIDAGCFGKDSPDLETAHNLLSGTGISLGSYGNG